MNKKIYIFIARNHAEFERYNPADSNCIYGSDARLSFCYKKISTGTTVAVIDDFPEKQALKKKCGKTLNDDDWLRFVVVIAAMVEKMTGLSSEEFEVVLFVHWGGVQISQADEFAQKIAERIKGYNRNQVVESMIERFFKRGLRIFSISTTAPQRLDLMSQKIHLPENENEMSEFIKRFDGAEGVRGKIRECFEKKWKCDSVRTASDRVVDDADYIAKCKELGFVAKEVS